MLFFLSFLSLSCCFVVVNVVNIAAVIHWTRQIKEVVSHQDAAQWSENAGPLAGIHFLLFLFDFILFDNQICINII